LFSANSLPTASLDFDLEVEHPRIVIDEKTHILPRPEYCDFANLVRLAISNVLDSGDFHAQVREEFIKQVKKTIGDEYNKEEKLFKRIEDITRIAL
jgi:hypothetical protein